MSFNTVHEAQQSLPLLIKRAVAGEDIVIGAIDAPLVRLVPCQAIARRQGGQWRGKVVIAEDFDVLPEAMLAALRGESDAH